MMKKLFVSFLCLACLLSLTAIASAEGEDEVSDTLPSITPGLDDSEAPVRTVAQMYISFDFSDTALLVTVADDEGLYVPNAPLAFDVGSTVNMLTTLTDGNGSAYLSLVGLDPGTAIVCHAAEFTNGVTNYLAASAATSVPGDIVSADEPEPVESETPTTTTTEATTADRTAATTLAPLPTLPSSDTDTTRTLPSYAEVRGATTTHAQGNDIHTNLLIDEHLLEQFGVGIDRFDQLGRLVVDKATYATLTETYGSHLFGKLTSSALSDVTTDQIRAAQSGVTAFSDCDPKNAVALTFAVSLQFLEDNGAGLPVTDASSLDADCLFEFDIPVPKSMENCKSFGIAMTGENVLNTLTPVTMRGGTISFRTPALGHFTLVGFTDGAAGGGSSLGTLMLILILLGVLVFGLMGFLIYRFFFRGRRDDPDDDPDGYDYDDYYEGEGGDDDGDTGFGGDDTPSQPDAPIAPEDAAEPEPEPEPAPAVSDDTMDMEALKKAWVEEDEQVQAILRDVAKKSRH